MDALPTEVVTHILTFLDGSVVAGFRLLNSRFGDVISKNRNIFRRPLIDIMFRSGTNYPQKIIDIHIDTKFCSFVNYTQPNSIKIAPFNQFQLRTICCPRGPTAGCISPSEHSIKRCVEFFRPYFESNSLDRSIDSLFQYILEKVDINELRVMNFRDNECLSALTRAIKGSSAVIREYQFRISNNFWNEYELLETIGKHHKRGFDYPRCRFQCSHGGISQAWEEFTKINEAAQFYKSCWYHTPYQIDCKTVASLINNLANTWLMKPFPKFHFGLCFVSNEDEEFEIYDIDDRFNINQRNAMYFLFHSTSIGDSFLQLKHRSTKKSLIFNKKNGSYETIDYRGIALKHVEVSIDVELP